jgi:RNA polymerase sigma factor for flagellar operon FliA
MSRRVESTEQLLANRLARTPTSDELAEALGTTTSELSSFRDRVFRSVVLALDQKMTSDNEEISLLDALCDRTVLEPSEELEARELRAYLRDAVSLLPERHRHVVVGYFLEGRTSDELARFLGVTESRVSQLRSEALVMLKEAIEAQYAEAAPVDDEPASARRARRKAGYAVAVAGRSDWRTRLSSPSTVG